MTRSRYLVCLRFAALVFGFGLIVLCAVLLATREPWHRLPSGREVRLVEVAYVETLTVTDPGFELEAVRDWLGPTFSRLLGPWPSTDTRSFWGPRFAVAFTSRGGNGSPALDERCEIDLPGGQTLQGDCLGAGGTNEKMVEMVSFAIAPFTERRVKMRLEVEGKTLHFDLRNPAFVSKPAAWKAQPLPQTHSVEGVEITLDRVEAEWKDHDRGGGSRWGADAFFSVGLNGKGAGEWFTCYHTFHDGFGNESKAGVSSSVLFSAPVWKVRCRAVKNDSYPYADAEVNWLGRMTLPAPGEAKVLSFTPATPRTELHLLALLGPGHYDIAAGKITAIPSPVKNIDAGEIRYYFPNPEGGDENIEITANGVELLNVGSPGLAEGEDGVWPALFVRDESGRPLRLKVAHRIGPTALLAVPLPPGRREVEVGLVEVHELISDFFIHPPLPPAQDGKANSDP